MNKEERIEYLEEERKKILEKILLLEDALNKKTSEYEAEAKISAEQAIGYKTTSEEAKNTVVSNLEEVTIKLAEIRNDYTSIVELNTQIKGLATTSFENDTLIKALHADVTSKAESIKNQIAEIEKIFERKAQLDEGIAKLGEVFTRGDDYDSKISALHKSIAERKKDIDELFYEIFGNTIKDEEGVETKVKGKKDELNESYNSIKSNLENIDKQLKELKDNTELEYKRSAEEKEKSFKESLAVWNEKYIKMEGTIAELLPNALTAGLSAAYSVKKVAEETESTKYSTTFQNAIWGLIGVSLIPFIVSMVSIFQQTELVVVIERIPRLVLAILPLYVPVLWVAYSANRKMNLSKRLIEEYSHKEVLSKTFERLSRQINNIDDKSVSADLRTKLLYNILEVNSENPGKLISDYNKSDYPLMDALDKSVKLTNAVTKLAKIPGFTKIATILEKKSEEVLKKENEKAEAGLETLEVEA